MRMQRENRNFNHNYSKLWSLIPPTPVFDVSMQFDPLMVFWHEALLLRLLGSKMGEQLTSIFVTATVLTRSTLLHRLFRALAQGGYHTNELDQL